MAENPEDAGHGGGTTPPAEEKTEFDDDTKRAIAEVFKMDGDQACENKDFVEAVRLYKEALDVQCKDDSLNTELKKALADAYKNEGNNAHKRKDYPTAVHFYSEGLQVNCDDNELNAKLYSNRATAYFNQKNYEATLIDAQIAVDLQPTYTKAMERGANACLQLGLYGEAINWCDKGLAIDKENKALSELRSKTIAERDKPKEQMTRDFPGGFSVPGGSFAGIPGVAGGFPAGTIGGGMSAEAILGGGETPILNDLLSDKELVAAFQDPETMQAFQDVSQNPSNLSKYPNKPKLRTIIDKLDKKFGPPGTGPPPGSGSGFSGGFSGGMPFGNMFGGP